MSKVVLFAASLLMVAGIASAGIINPCNSPVTFNGTLPECYFACPQGDTKTLLNEGFSFSFIIRDLSGNPIPSVPFSDFWLVDCDPQLDLALCGGSGSVAGADSSTNTAGRTTMGLTTLHAGKCADGLSPVVQGYILGSGTQPCPAYCFNVRVRSCDMNGDLNMTIQDVAGFSLAYPPNAYSKCADFNCDGAVNIQDLSGFAFHYGPPGHKCV